MPKKHQPEADLKGVGVSMYQIYVGVDLDGGWIHSDPSVPKKHRAAVADALRSAIQDLEGTRTNRSKERWSVERS